MRENSDITDAFDRILPPSDQIGALFRGAGFLIRSAALSRKRNDEERKEPDRLEDQPQPARPTRVVASALTGDMRSFLGLRRLLRITSALRMALADLRAAGHGLPPPPAALAQRPQTALPLSAQRSSESLHVPMFSPPPRLPMVPSELSPVRARASISALRSSQSRARSWLIVLTSEMGDGPVPPAWLRELNCPHFVVFEVEMLNDLVISAGSSVACILLDGRHQNRALAELAIFDAKRRYPAIRSVLLETSSGAPEQNPPFDVRLRLPLSRARLKWAIVAGAVMTS